MLGARLDPEESLRFYAHWLHEFWTIRPRTRSSPRAPTAPPERAQARIEGVRRAAGWIPSARRLRNLRGVLMQIIRWPGHFWPLVEPCPPLGAVAELERANISSAPRAGGSTGCGWGR